MKTQTLVFGLLAMFSLSAIAEAPKVCVALRGNGFRVAAHFGAMSRVVEEVGVPDAMVGGSSSNITMFITESAVMNPWLPQDAEAKKETIAFLLKSVPEYMLNVTNYDVIKDVRDLAGNKEDQKRIKEVFDRFNSIKNPLKYGYAAWVFATEGLFRNLLQIKNSVYTEEAIHPEFLAYMSQTGQLKKDLKKEKDPLKQEILTAVIAYREKQVADALGSASKFDARTDVNLFFRPGIIHHRGLAHIFDRIASFYAGYNMHTKKLRDETQNWIKTCAPNSKGLTFREIEARNPFCGTELRRLGLSYLKNYDRISSRMRTCTAQDDIGARCKRFRHDDRLGKKILTYSMTSVMRGDTVTAYNKMAAEFDMTSDPDFGNKFKGKVDDFRIGYFGDEAILNTAKNRLSAPFVDQVGRPQDFTQDFKSNRLVALGNAAWNQALPASAAEPGQSRPVAATLSSGEKVLTFGGWADPNSAHLLKGLDCETTLAVMTSTKVGYNFGEQVIKRLMPDMAGIQELSDEEIAYGTDDMTSQFSLWRNPKNPLSSENISLKAADGVMCTQWDEESALDTTRTLEENFRALAEIGYVGKTIINDHVPSQHKLRKTGLVTFDKEDNVFDTKWNRPLYNGCIAN